MSINQIWFIDIPLDTGLSAEDLAQICIGFSFYPPGHTLNYFRRYLNDVDVTYPISAGVAVNTDTEVDGPDNRYMRKYLNDIDKVVPSGPMRSIDTEVDGEYNRYYRRYLNDKG